jgi:acetyltransferase EpsM
MNIIIFGGSAGSNIAEEIFKNTFRQCNIFLCETFKKIGVKDKILSFEKSINLINNHSYDYFIATGDNFIRSNLYSEIHSLTNKNPINCIHDSSFISTSAEIGFGNLIAPKSVLHTNCKVGNCTIINTGSIVEHGCDISHFTQMSPGSTLCGNVSISEYCFVGAGATIIPNIKIGKYSLVAAGSSVTKDIPENVMVAGAPCTIKKTNYYEISDSNL